MWMLRLSRAARESGASGVIPASLSYFGRSSLRLRWGPVVLAAGVLRLKQDGGRRRIARAVDRDVAGSAVVDRVGRWRGWRLGGRNDGGRERWLGGLGRGAPRDRAVRQGGSLAAAGSR